MLLGIYLGTTIYAWRTMLKYVKEFNQRLDEDGYEVTGKYTLLLEKLILAFVMTCPVINLSCPLLFSNIDYTYDYYKKIVIDKGLVRYRGNYDINVNQVVDETESILNEYKIELKKTSKAINKTIKKANKKAKKIVLYEPKKFDKKLKKLTKEINNQTIIDERVYYPLMEQHNIMSNDNGYSYKKVMKR